MIINKCSTEMDAVKGSVFYPMMGRGVRTLPCLLDNVDCCSLLTSSHFGPGDPSYIESVINYKETEAGKKMALNQKLFSPIYIYG